MMRYCLLYDAAARCDDADDTLLALPLCWFIRHTTLLSYDDRACHERC